jgi:L-proline amide hydrolase
VAVTPYADLIPGARWEIFDESSHLPNVEEPARYLAVVESFLRGTP